MGANFVRANVPHRSVIHIELQREFGRHCPKVRAAFLSVKGREEAASALDLNSRVLRCTRLSRNSIGSSAHQLTLGERKEAFYRCQGQKPVTSTLHERYQLPSSHVGVTNMLCWFRALLDLLRR